MASLEPDVLPYEVELARGIAGLWEARGLATTWWGVAIPAGARWPVLQGPDMPDDRDEVLVLTPRPSTPAPVGFDLITPVGVRLRTRAGHADGRDRTTLRNEAWLLLESLRDVVAPFGRPGGPHRFGRVGVGRIEARPTLFYDADGSERLGASMELLVRSRRRFER